MSHDKTIWPYCIIYCVASGYLHVLISFINSFLLLVSNCALNFRISSGGCHGCFKFTSSNINENLKLRMLEDGHIYLFFQLISNRGLVL